MVVSGTTLRVVEGLFAEMREQPGGRAKGEGLRVESCWLRVEGWSLGQKYVWAEKWEPTKN